MFTVLNNCFIFNLSTISIAICTAEVTCNRLLVEKGSLMHNVNNKDILDSLNKVTEKGVLEFLHKI